MTWLDYCVSFIPKLIKNYKRCSGRTLDISKPLTFTDKIQWLKIYDSTMLKAFAADKVTVHAFYKMQLGMDIGIPLIAVYDNPDEIDWNSLPSDMVIKCNHGSGYNLILHDKSPKTIKSTKETLVKWLNEDYANRYCELHYSLIPRKILVEQYIDNLVDSKIFCFNGVPKFYQIDKHFTENRMNFYDMQGKPLTWLSNTHYPANYKVIDEIPPHMDELADMAAKLCKPFKFVRVDFYTAGDKIYGGELTFTPGAGIQSYAGEGDRKLGDMLDLQ